MFARSASTKSVNGVDFSCCSNPVRRCHQTDLQNQGPRIAKRTRCFHVPLRPNPSSNPLISSIPTVGTMDLLLRGRRLMHMGHNIGFQLPTRRKTLRWSETSVRSCWRGRIYAEGCTAVASAGGFQSWNANDWHPKFSMMALLDVFTAEFTLHYPYPITTYCRGSFPGCLPPVTMQWVSIHPILKNLDKTPCHLLSRSLAAPSSSLCRFPSSGHLLTATRGWLSGIRRH